MTERNYTIGQVSRLSGISVRRLRFYADEGMLPPAGRTAGGYRVFTDADLVRIDLIRALREAGIGLPAIREVLSRRKSMADVLALRLAEIEAQIGAQRRVAAALKAALRSGEPTNDDLRRIWTMTNLSTAECHAAIEGFIAEVAKDRDIDPGWAQWAARMSKPELPDEPSAEQIDAWIELRGLLNDPKFIQDMRENARDSYARPFDTKIFQEVQDSLLPRARQALADGVKPQSELGLGIGREFYEGWARAHRIEPDAEYWGRMKRKEFAHKAKTRRYWDLVHTIGGLRNKSEPDPAWLWIGDASKHFLATM